MNQPDFTKIFFDHFGGKPQKIRYELRLPPHLLHDLAFLTSLVHDARFQRKDIVYRGKRLTIPINRDCWEIPITEENEFHIAESKLVFATVRDIRWIFSDISDSDPSRKLWIDYLYVDEEYGLYQSDRMGFVVSGHHWKLQFSLSNMEYTVKLQDHEVPYLYSKKSHKKSM